MPGVSQPAMTHRLRPARFLMILGLFASMACDSPIPSDPPQLTQANSPPPPSPIESDFVSSEFPHPLPIASAREILLRSRVFDLPPLGDPGSNKNRVFLPPLAPALEASRLERAAFRKLQAYYVLLDASDAAIRFDEIFRIGSPAARAYALCGLHATNPTQFRARALQLAHSDLEVTTHGRGCTGNSCTFGDFVRDLERGHYWETLREVRPEVEEYFKKAG